MSIFVRSAFHYTRRTLHDLVSINVSSKTPPKSAGIINSTFAKLNINLVANNDIIINKKLRNNEEIADNHWIEIRKELLTKYKKNLSENTVDLLVYDLCKHHKRSDEAKNYFKFLERNSHHTSLSTLRTYLKFLIKGKEVSEAEQEEIYRICELIKKNSLVMDSGIYADCILALSLTKRWNEGFEILNKVQFSDIVMEEVVHALCSAAFKNNKPDLAWKLMNKFIDKFPMAPIVYLEYLEYCKRNFEGQNLVEEIEKMFYFWKENYIVIGKFVIKEYLKTFSNLGYQSTFSSVHEEEKCSECHTTLEHCNLSENDFKTLSLAVLKKLIIGQNIYESTSPQDLKRYLIFIKTLKPYDLIIDGLNLAYTTTTHERRGSLDNILQAINSFRKEYKRVLVIGRAHMSWWSIETMKKIEEVADVFLLKNVTQDDSFLLHLTFVSGPQTYFVSQDLMRQQIEKLEEDNLKKLFKYWLLTRQYLIEYDKKANAVKFLPPVSIFINTQKANNSWHIPCTKNSFAKRPTPEFYACLTIKESPAKQ